MLRLAYFYELAVQALARVMIVGNGHGVHDASGWHPPFIFNRYNEWELINEPVWRWTPYAKSFERIIVNSDGDGQPSSILNRVGCLSNIGLPLGLYGCKPSKQRGKDGANECKDSPESLIFRYPSDVLRSDRAMPLSREIPLVPRAFFAFVNGGVIPGHRGGVKVGH
jgi:hypothetical protein